MSLNLKKINEEVYYTTEAITKIDYDYIEFLKLKAKENFRKRARICVHPEVSDPLHEMIIVHERGNYVCPHKHINKSESFHIIEGRLNVIIFNDTGGVLETIRMGRETSDIFYYRLSKGCFHTVEPVSKTVVFHETINGPFRPDQTVFAPWAPPEPDQRR